MSMGGAGRDKVAVWAVMGVVVAMMFNMVNGQAYGE